jgi:dihydrofolate reductase
MATYVYIACSLDGYIAGIDGSLDWLVNIPNEKNDDFGYGAFIEKIDGIVMGRKTFETVLGFESWPYTKPVFVLSNTMVSVPESVTGKAEIVNGPLEDLIQSLRLRGIVNLYVDGGQTIQSFLKAGLIDEMIITTIAKIIGEGVPLFGAIHKEVDFAVVRSEILNPYMVKNYFRRDADA